MSIALIRGITSTFGPAGGAALMYTLDTILLIVLLGKPRLRTANWFYLVTGGALFVTYDVCISLALGYAHSDTRAVEVSVVKCALWTEYALSDEHLSGFTLGSNLELLVAALAVAGGYALWNIGLMRGHLTLLATASYFAPVLSSAFATVWLGALLRAQFWQGAILVTAGSLLCWYATRQQSNSTAPISLD